MKAKRGFAPSDEPRPWQRAATAGQCPVDPVERAWIEHSMRWFVDQFGLEAAQRPLALPTPDFYPAGFSGTAEQIEELVHTACEVMGADRSKLVIEFFDSGPEADRTSSAASRTRAVGHFWMRDGQQVIDLDLRKAGDPAVLSAIIAHELGHARLSGERRITQQGERLEQLTDLVTVFLGMGVFNANAARTFTKTAVGWSAAPLGDISEQMLIGSGHGDAYLMGYLQEPAFGYALACLCGLRRETEPAWAAYLDPGPRAQLNQSLDYFRHLAAG